MSWASRIRRGLFGGGTPTYDGVGSGRRAIAWQVANPGAVAALAFSQNELRAKSRDLVRRNAWAAAGVEAFVANAIGTGIKPQSMVADLRQQVIAQIGHSLSMVRARGRLSEPFFFSIPLPLLYPIFAIMNLSFQIAGDADAPPCVDLARCRQAD